ncbi:MAG: hypothetical protein V4627_11940 [Pseudomonadota bacterium]
MDIQPLQMQHQSGSAAALGQPRDLTWLGMADDRELLCRAREIAAQNIQGGHAAKVFDGMAAKLNSWQLAQG